jgi:hypothetical protein
LDVPPGTLNAIPEAGSPEEGGSGE